MKVQVTGFRNGRGQALLALFTSERGFPGERDAAHAATALPIDGDSVETAFDDVPPGPFAVAALHDENGNFRMDTNILGMPKEGYGLSRNVRPRFRSPKFEDARLELAPGATRYVSIQLVYP